MSMSDHELPQDIVDHQASGELELVWQDHTSARLPHALLRSRCRCAGCEQQFRQTGRRAEVSPGIRLSGIQPIGDKGLNLVFTDGHGRGIYPWAYLRELAQAHSGAREALVSSGIASAAAVAHA